LYSISKAYVKSSGIQHIAGRLKLNRLVNIP